MTEPEGAIASAVLARPLVAERLRGLVRAARPKQWVKNAACLAGVVFSDRLLDAPSVGKAALAFAGFSLASSGVYLVNDVFDREADRENPRKRYRPIASGVVPVSWAMAAAVLLLAAALASSVALSPLSRLVLAAYAVTGLAYSYGLKHHVLLDVLVIASGFVLRVLYGVYAIGVKPSSWIVLCMFFLALFLGFAKRRSELNQISEGGYLRRPVLRGYDLGFLDMSLGMTATMAVVCYALYTVTGRPGNATLVVTVPLVAYGVLRYLLKVMARGAGDEPETDIFCDKVSLAIIFTWAALCASVLHTDVRLFEQ
jgi:4-hydroxybenzoate polyprenyltransferase